MLRRSLQIKDVLTHLCFSPHILASQYDASNNNVSSLWLPWPNHHGRLGIKKRSLSGWGKLETALSFVDYINCPSPLPTNNTHLTKLPVWDICIHGNQVSTGNQRVLGQQVCSRTRVMDRCLKWSHCQVQKNLKDYISPSNNHNWLVESIAKATNTVVFEQFWFYQSMGPGSFNVYIHYY